jgi:hypothetical protein
MTFTCPTPNCGAQHNRGAFDGVDVYRCLRCGNFSKGPNTGAKLEPPPKRLTRWDRLRIDWLKPEPERPEPPLHKFGALGDSPRISPDTAAIMDPQEWNRLFGANWPKAAT